MTESEMLERLGYYNGMLDECFHHWLKSSSFCVQPVLLEAMRHSLMAGGKRLRPALFLAWAEACDADCEKFTSFAAAIEMIHTYSLIHDDLPPMDNADMRRGKPSCHKKYGEATAMLAGDALLTDAFYMATKCAAKPENIVAAIRALALAAGSSGMVDGQMLDLTAGQYQKTTRNELEILQAKKTGAMFAASCQCGVILGDGVPRFGDSAHRFGLHLGAAFQIYDDVLDVIGDVANMGKPVGLDAANARTTWPGLIGVEASLNEAHREAATALELTGDVPEPQGSFLRAVVEYAVGRKN